MAESLFLFVSLSLHFSQSAHFVRSITLDGAARIFLPPYAAAGIQTYGRVAPTWDLLKDVLPTELFLAADSFFDNYANDDDQQQIF